MPCSVSVRRNASALRRSLRLPWRFGVRREVGAKGAFEHCVRLARCLGEQRVDPSVDLVDQTSEYPSRWDEVRQGASCYEADRTRGGCLPREGMRSGNRLPCVHLRTGQYALSGTIPSAADKRGTCLK